jgi:magnesium transporter
MATVVAFDFATKQEETIALAAAPQVCGAGRFCWIDIDTASAVDSEAAADLMGNLGIPPAVIAAVLSEDDRDRYDIHEECLHFRVFAARFDAGRFAGLPVDLVLGDTFLVTIRRGEVEFINQMRRTYRQDFVRFAQGPGFLLYECWDHLLDGYRTAVRGLTLHVRRLQEQIFGEVDDMIFTSAAAVTRDLLAFRQTVLTAREILNALCIRRSPFVSETTQPYLEKMVHTLGRLDVDLSVEREILSETLNLYIGIVSYRTGKVLNRLTIVSLVFLPLSFLCGVYGMNFKGIPEIQWEYGYIFFWTITLMIVGATLAYMKRLKLW